MNSWKVLFDLVFDSVTLASICAASGYANNVDQEVMT